MFGQTLKTHKISEKSQSHSFVISQDTYNLVRRDLGNN